MAFPTLYECGSVRTGGSYLYCVWGGNLVPASAKTASIFRFHIVFQLKVYLWLLITNLIWIILNCNICLDVSKEISNPRQRCFAGTWIMGVAPPMGVMIRLPFSPMARRAWIR